MKRYTTQINIRNYDVHDFTVARNMGMFKHSAYDKKISQARELANLVEFACNNGYYPKYEKEKGEK